MEETCILINADGEEESYSLQLFFPGNPFTDSGDLVFSLPTDTVSTGEVWNHADVCPNESSYVIADDPMILF